MKTLMKPNHRKRLHCARHRHRQLLSERQRHGKSCPTAFMVRTATAAATAAATTAEVRRCSPPPPPVGLAHRAGSHACRRLRRCDLSRASGFPTQAMVMEEIDIEHVLPTALDTRRKFFVAEGGVRVSSPSRKPASLPPARSLSLSLASRRESSRHGVHPPLFSLTRPRCFFQDLHEECIVVQDKDFDVENSIFGVLPEKVKALMAANQARHFPPFSRCVFVSMPCAFSHFSLVFSHISLMLRRGDEDCEGDGEDLSSCCTVL
jgi:hypothetical protein